MRLLCFMTAQLFATLQTRAEQAFLAEAVREAGQRPSGYDLYSRAIGRINRYVATGESSRELVSLIRMALKLNPYSPELNSLADLHNRAVRAWFNPRMPELAATAKACREKKLPVPVIVSCAKYLGKARALREELQNRYFGVSPIIVMGDPSLGEETFRDNILSLPVSDSYEALPVKILETCVFLQAFDEGGGFIKIDDDLTRTPMPPLDLAATAHFFTLGDYFGQSVETIFPDRIWHAGKCSQPTPPVYGKPVKAAWARGALYYLSPSALRKLTLHYMRFPGALDGEMYEDKAVGDILYDNQVMVVKCPLESVLGLDSTSPERLNE